MSRKGGIDTAVGGGGGGGAMGVAMQEGVIQSGHRLDTTGVMKWVMDLSALSTGAGLPLLN